MNLHITYEMCQVDIFYLTFLVLWKGHSTKLKPVIKEQDAMRGVLCQIICIQVGMLV